MPQYGEDGDKIMTTAWAVLSFALGVILVAFVAFMILELYKLGTLAVLSGVVHVGVFSAAAFFTWDVFLSEPDEPARNEITYVEFSYLGPRGGYMVQGGAGVLGAR